MVSTTASQAADTSSSHRYIFTLDRKSRQFSSVVLALICEKCEATGCLSCSGPLLTTFPTTRHTHNPSHQPLCTTVVGNHSKSPKYNDFKTSTYYLFEYYETVRNSHLFTNQNLWIRNLS